MAAESDASGRKLAGEHSPGHVLEPDREVDCACDRRLHRPVLRDPSGWNSRVTTCLRCGVVTLVEALVEEPHPNDVQCVGNRILAVNPEVLAWLAAWPRLAWGVWEEDRQVYLPAALVCQTPEALAVEEQKHLARQVGLSAAERLRSVGYPSAPPPDLPRDFQTFAATQIGLSLTAASDVETLLSHADRSDWAMPFAYDILRKRPDFVPIVVGLLASAERRATGLSLVQFGNLKHPEIVTALIGQLAPAQADPEGEPWLQSLLSALAQMGPAAAAAGPILAELARKVGDRDYYLTKRIEQVRERIKEKPAR